MSIAGIGGFLFGSLVGSLLRPALDSYIQWRHMKAARSEMPTYPFLTDEEERDPWPM